jgi:glycosyltransferase involved in cell wall biosynthesis
MLPDKISIIIPAFKESKTIRQNLERIVDVMNGLGYDYELIVVDDGSDDGTYDIAEINSEENPRIKVVRYTPNVGKGYAIKTGFKHATGSIIGYMDADLNLDTEQLEEYIKRLEGADAVIASKRHPESHIVYPLHRRILSNAFNMLVRLLFRFDISDTQCGFKFFKREVLDKVVPCLSIKRWAFDVELLVLVDRFGYEIAEGPISFSQGESRLKMMDIFNMFLDLLGIFYRLNFTRTYEV